MTCRTPRVAALIDRDGAGGDRRYMAMMTMACELERVLEDFTKAVEKIAFEIPAPNPYTPRLVQMCQEARNSATMWLSGE